MSDHLYFHTSGEIVCRPAATEQDVAQLLALARGVADTTDSSARMGILRALVIAFHESASFDALCPDADLTRLSSVRDEAELLWVDTIWERLFRVPAVGAALATPAAAAPTLG